MKDSYRIFLTAVLCAMALGSEDLGAQSPPRVTLSEVRLLPRTPGDTRWIEVHNSGDLTADLSGWGIYQTTKTQGLPGIHWWAFPEGTSLAAGAYLRVHWYAAYQPSTATDFYTGRHPLRFLFGLGAEDLDPLRGALALLNDVSAAGTNQESSYEDWISWGEDGYSREELAVSNGRWVAGEYVGPLLSPGSIALDFARESPAGQPTRASAYFHDASPTPLDCNHRGAQISAPIGWSCAVGLANPPKLEVTSVPTAGNMDFALRVRGSIAGISNRIVLLLVTPRPGVGTSLPGIFECPFWVDLSATPKVFLKPAGGSDTTFSLPLGGATGGLEFTAQAIQIRDPYSLFDHASSQGLSMRLGR